MKILLVSSRYAPHDIGGAERVVRMLASELGGQGHEVVVLTAAFRGDAPSRTIDGIRVRAIPVRNLYGFDDFARRPLKPLWHMLDSDNPLMRAPVDDVLAAERPDLLHSHLVTGFSPMVWRVAAARQIPIVHTLHDFYVVCARSSMAIDGRACARQHLSCAMLSRPRRAAANDVTAVVGVSQFILERHHQIGAFTENPHQSVIGNPCGLVGTHMPPRSGPTIHEPLRLGYLGRLIENKGITRLLESLEGFRRGAWHLAVAGAGPTAFVDALRARFESDAVSLVGHRDPAEFLGTVDVLLAPSLGPESFGLSVAEALAMGVPVVASNRGALPELIAEGKTGFVYDPDVPGALTSVLDRLIDNGDWVHNAADACRASVAPLAPRTVTDRYLELYQSVIAE